MDTTRKKEKAIGKSRLSILDASKKEERLLPMAFGALFFLLGFVTLRMLNAQLLIQGIMFCGMINVILAWLITNYWKISIHAITLASSITIFWIFGYQNIFIVILILFILIIVITLLLKAVTCGIPVAIRECSE